MTIKKQDGVYQNEPSPGQPQPQDPSQPYTEMQAQFPVVERETRRAEREDFSVTVSYSRLGSAAGWSISVSVGAKKEPISYGAVFLNGQKVYTAPVGVAGFGWNKPNQGTYPGKNKLQVKVEEFTWEYEWE